MSVFYALRRGRHGPRMFASPRSPRHDLWVWCLALALCLAPTWGQIHRVLHLPHALGLVEHVQGSLGAMKADIRTNALGIIGFKDAESLGLYFAGRLGVEWYMIDRHFALGLTGGLRDATNFKQRGGSGGDTPLAFDAGASIRYAF